MEPEQDPGHCSSCVSLGPRGRITPALLATLFPTPSGSHCPSWGCNSFLGVSLQSCSPLGHPQPVLALVPSLSWGCWGHPAPGASENESPVVPQELILANTEAAEELFDQMPSHSGAFAIPSSTTSCLFIKGCVLKVLCYHQSIITPRYQTLSSLWQGCLRITCASLCSSPPAWFPLAPEPAGVQQTLQDLPWE